jgi:hypothetical protein
MQAVPPRCAVWPGGLPLSVGHGRVPLCGELLMGCPPFRYPRLRASGRQGRKTKLLELMLFESICLRQ